MKKINRKIGFIGCGNMGSAILAGLLRSGISRPKQVSVYDTVRSKARALAKKFRVRVAKNNRDLIGSSEVILLAIKPQDLSRFADEVQSLMSGNKTVISILAGTPIQKLKRALGRRVKIVRAMPNLGAQVSEAVTAVTSSTPSALVVGERIFAGCGRVIRLSEKHFDLVTAVSGSGPAYFFLMMELLAGFARRRGLNGKAAKLLAVQTAVGAGKLAQASSLSPGKLRQMVTSKRGTTDAALRYFSKKGFGKTFVGGVDRAVKRSKQISRS